MKAIVTVCDEHGHNPTCKMVDTDMITRQQRRQLERDNNKMPAVLIQIPRDKWPTDPISNRTEVWRSRDFLVQVFQEEGAERLSVNKTRIGQFLDVETFQWAEEITWDELQELKRQCGRGDKCAVEIYPPSSKVVNVANMRHLWVIEEMPKFAWGAR